MKRGLSSLLETQKGRTKRPFIMAKNRKSGHSPLGDSRIVEQPFIPADFALSLVVRDANR